MKCSACGEPLEVLLKAEPALAKRWEKLPRRQLRPGEAIFQPGVPLQSAWMVKSGLVRLFYLGEDGTKRNRSFHPEGSWIGSVPGAAGHALACGAEALEASTLVELPHAEF